MGKITMIIYGLFIAGFSRAFYCKVICKNVLSNQSLIKGIGIFCANFFRLLWYVIHTVNNKESSGEDQIWLKILEEMGKVISRIIYAVLFVLIFGAVLSCMDSKGILLWIMVLSVGGREIIKLSYDHESEITEMVITVYTVNRIFREHNESLSVKEKLSRRLVFQFIMVTVIPFSLYWAVQHFLPTLGQSKAGVAFGILGLIWICGSEKWEKRQRVKKYRTSKKEIKIRGERIELFADEIAKMCKIIGICDIEIREEKGIGAIANACYHKNERSLILLDSSLLEYVERKSGMTGGECIKLILAHELIHIYYKEPQSITGNIRKAALLGMGIYLLGLLGLVGAAVLFHMLLMPAGMLILFGFIYNRICYDQRYWIQLQEIRADRRGIELCGLSYGQALRVNNILYELENDGQKEDSIMYKIYLRTTPWHGHLKRKRRQAALMQERGWGWYYYIWLFIEIVRGRIKGEGWYGN